MELKILSFNIHKGMAWHSRTPTLLELRDFIRQTGADLVFLQEVHGENRRHLERMHQDFDSQYEFLADEVWQHYCYAKNAVYDHGHHGNVILSKYPIVEWSKEDISTNRLEHRGLLSAKINLAPEAGPTSAFFLHAYCVHLNLLPQGRLLQYQQIQAKILKEAQEHGPIILAGDFNDWNHAAKNHLEKKLNVRDCHYSLFGKYAKTFPCFWPSLSLDRIYIRNAKAKDAQILRPTGGLSDHLPLYAVIDM